MTPAARWMCELRSARSLSPAAASASMAGALASSMAQPPATCIDLRSARMTLGSAQQPVAIAEHELLQLPVGFATRILARVREKAGQRRAKGFAECFHGCVSE